MYGDLGARKILTGPSSLLTRCLTEGLGTKLSCPFSFHCPSVPLPSPLSLSLSLSLCIYPVSVCIWEVWDAVKYGIQNNWMALIDWKWNGFVIADITRVELPSGEVALPMLALLSVFWSCGRTTNASNFVEDLDCCPKARPVAKISTVLSSKKGTSRSGIIVVMKTRHWWEEQ